MVKPVEKNEEYIVDIVDNGVDGEGIAKIERYTIFIPGAIKGERLKVLIVKANNRGGTDNISAAFLVKDGELSDN